jgi:hypothetical protein
MIILATGQSLPTEEGTKDPDKAQEDAKNVRKQQQKELREQTGDTLYPASGRGLGS